MRLQRGPQSWDWSEPWFQKLSLSHLASNSLTSKCISQKVESTSRASTIQQRAFLRSLSQLLRANKHREEVGKGSYLDSWWGCCCLEQILSVTVGQSERQSRAEGRCSQRLHVGGRVDEEGDRNIREEVRKCLWAEREREARTERGESSDSGAFTQRCHRLEGMCCVQEVVPLTETTSPSLLKTIG